MNFYEADIIRLRKKITEIDQNPDPLKLKSYKIRYNRQIELRKEQLEAWQQGAPFIDVGFHLKRLGYAMGFNHISRGAIIKQNPEPEKYLEKAREMGLPADSSCDSVYMVAAMVEARDIPVESIVVCKQYACTPEVMQKIFIAHRGERLAYCFDSPFEETEVNLEYLVDQLRAFIEFAEKKFPGVIKYDEDKLSELQARDEAAWGYYHEIFQMLKHKPSPIAGDDVSYTHGGDFTSRDPEYVRALRDEVAERVAKGIAAVPGEKLRMIWTVQNIEFMDVYKVLAKHKIAVIFQYNGSSRYYFPGPNPVYYGGRKLTPLEKEAADGLKYMYGGSGPTFVNNMIWLCRELKVDAIINHNLLGCTAVLGLKRMIEEQAEKELGIPTLQLEGKIWDQSYASEATITAKLDEFAQMCLSQRGLA